MSDPRFKKGDRVRVLDAMGVDRHFKVGDELTVAAHVGPYVAIEGVAAQVPSFLPHRFELIEEIEPPYPMSFSFSMPDGSELTLREYTIVPDHWVLSVKDRRGTTEEYSALSLDDLTALGRLAGVALLISKDRNNER